MTKHDAAWAAREAEKRRWIAEHGMYSEAEEHSSCGVGLVVAIDGAKSRKVVENGIDIAHASFVHPVFGSEATAQENHIVNVSEDSFDATLLPLSVPIPVRGAQSPSSVSDSDSSSDSIPDTTSRPPLNACMAEHRHYEAHARDQRRPAGVVHR